MYNHQGKEKDVSLKRTQFRKRIRRQQIDRYFQSRRKEILQKESSSFEYGIKLQLTTLQGRNYFLANINQLLIQTAPNKWKNILQEIIISVPYFNQNFDQWLQTKILNTLGSTIKSEMSQLGHQHLIMKIFTSILNHIKEVPSKIVDHIIRTLIIQNAVVFMKIVQLPLQYQIDYFYFLSTLSRIDYKIRNFILSIGAGSLLQQFGKKILRQTNFNQEMRYNFLGICSDFLKIFIAKDIKRYPDPSFVLAVIPIIFDLLEVGGSDRIINIALICLLIIVKGNRQIYYKRFMSPNILQHLFELMKIKSFGKKSLSILTYLTSSQSNQVIELIVKMGVKDFLYQANCQIADYQFIILTLNLLDHLTLSQEEVQDLIHHKIWGIACDSLTFNNPTVRYQGYHFINAVMTAIDKQSLQLQLFKDNNFIDTAISQIQNFKKYPAYVTVQALKLLNTYIILQSKSKHFQTFHIFESVYRLSLLLQKIENESSNSEIVEKASIVRDIYSYNYMDNCTN